MTMPGGAVDGVLLTLAQNDDVRKSLLEYIAEGREIGLIIILLSLVAAGVITVQLLRLRRAKLAPPEAVGDLDSMLRAGRVEAAIEYCENPENTSFLTRVLGAAMARCARSPFGFLELRSAIEEAGQHRVASLHRSADVVGLIASVAPMLGLLGTVVGMVGAFDAITVSDGPVRPDELAGSISQALVTTVLGLIVAIPCTAMYTYLRNRIDEHTSEVGDVLEDLAALVEVSARAPGGAGAGGA